MMDGRCACHECGWVGTCGDLLVDVSPFDKGMLIRGCPECKWINGFEAECGDDDCWSGSRETCSVHKPKEGK